MVLGFDAFDALTFDCYGTLIDWEAGLLAALRGALGDAATELGDDALLERYAAQEAALEAGPYRPYREILGLGARALGRELGAKVSLADEVAMGNSVVDWPAFPDSAAALGRLATRFKLGVLTNCDDDLFAASNRRLGVTFHWIVTAQQARGYKPRPENFELLLERVGLPRERVLHVAQSLFHDHVPARAMGLRTVWIDRRHDRAGSGATPAAEARPDARFTSMADFAAAAVP